jgi:arylsulfatase
MRSRKYTAAIVAALVVLAADGAQAQAKKPNILMIMGDDIGWFNPSVYNRGVMGYKTPSIDRIAAEGAMFTDWYGQQSCTAGRAAFVTGQSPIRTGLTSSIARTRLRSPSSVTSTRRGCTSTRI